MENLDTFLDELERLDSNFFDVMASTSISTPNNIEKSKKIDVIATSSLAPDQIQAINSTATSNSSSFLFPVFQSPYASEEAAKNIFDQVLDPKTLLGFLYEDLEEREEASYLLHKCPYQSRTLAQFPMSKPRIEILPSRETMILDPCNLKYYFSPIEEQKTGIIYDAGFSSALNRKTVTRMDEYARGKIGNTPFAPGGETLVQLEQEKQEVKKAVEDPLAIFQLEHEQKRNALVLDTQKPFDLNDLVALHELEIQAPGLNDHLKVEDFLVATEKKEEIESTEEEQQQEEEEIGFGSNPKDLLKPYMDVMGDQNNVEAIKRLVKDEKEAHALQATAATKSITTEGTLTIEDLIAGLDDEDEDELFGNIEEQEEQEASLQQTEDTSLMATCTSSTTSLQTSTLPSAIATAKENTELEPEEELEAMLSGAEKLLSSDTSSLSAPKATTTSTNTTEWASTKSIDVRNFHQLVPEMAMEYTFELDTFQKEAIVHLENHECVFIAAHTSAGKTVVAEYAIGMSQKHMTRTIYTSPIKALSNQKYRDFREKYGPDQVGIITGDVSINPEASCLVMTTEILRSMLYRGADVIRDIEWVIFDEIHYINDSERGVVWEEVIIMLPDHIGMVFLSATTPNTFEFSDWIGRTKKKKIHVISTLKRPVPLEHFLYVKKDFIKLMDKNGQFLTGAYGQAMQKLYPTTKGAAAGAGGGRFTGGKFLSNRMTSAAGDQSDWFKFVHTLQEKNLLPVVVFAFSKRLCEESASKLKKMDLTNGPSEKAEIHLFLEQSVQRLQGSDRELPQVLNMKEMLKRGIGVHHGGLLPILKEMVEILFAKGLVKVLFATETFAMGVNMPARTVVFNGGVRKHDGKVFRDLSAGEYTQMAGRAGRRGLDSVGTVIIACWQDVPPEATTLQKMLVGKATLLTSQFRLTYNMILNLLRVEDMTVEDMMKRSFSEFRTQKMLSSKQIPKQIKKCQHLMKNVQNLLKEEYPLVQELGQLDILDQLVQTHLCLLKSQKKMVHTILHSKFGSIAVTPGRLVGVSIKGFVDRSTTHSPLIAVILRTTSKQSSSGNTLLGGDMIDHSSGTFKSLTVLFLCPEDYEPPCLTMKEEEKDNRKTTTNRSSDHLTGLNQLNKKKNSAMDFFMPKGNANKKDKRFGSINKEEPPKEEKLVSGMSGHLLGHKYAVLDISESCLDILMATSMEINMRSVLNNVKSEVSKAIQMLIDIKEEVDTFKRQQCALVTFSTRFLNPMQDLKINDLEIAQMYDEVHSNELNLQQVSTLLMSTSQSNNVMVFMGALLDKIYKIYALRTLIGRFQSALSNHALLLFPDFQQRLSVLTKLGYLSEEDNIVQLKGRVACEVNTCDELLLTEMIFENVLAHLEPEEIVSVLSALIFQEKTQSEPKLTPRLEYAKDQVKLIAESLGLIQLEQHLDIDPAVYCKNALNFGLMEVVYEWARGMPFKTLCDLTDIPEGSIVRCITRLDEVCREVRNAAKIIGDPRLYRKMEVASESIKRDVVFASSLYLA